MDAEEAKIVSSCTDKYILLIISDVIDSGLSDKYSIASELKRTSHILT